MACDSCAIRFVCYRCGLHTCCGAWSQPGLCNGDCLPSLLPLSRPLVHLSLLPLTNAWVHYDLFLCDDRLVMHNLVCMLLVGLCALVLATVRIASNTTTYELTHADSMPYLKRSTRWRWRVHSPFDRGVVMNCLRFWSFTLDPREVYAEDNSKDA